MSRSQLEHWVSRQLELAVIGAPKPSDDMAERAFARVRRHRGRAVALSVAAAVALVIGGVTTLAALRFSPAAPTPVVGASTRPTNPSPALSEPCPVLRGGAEPGYNGLTVAQARARAHARGLAAFRIVGVDGRCFVTTADLDFKRLNVYVVNGRVTWAQRE